MVNGCLCMSISLTSVVVSWVSGLIPIVIPVIGQTCEMPCAEHCGWHYFQSAWWTFHALFPWAGNCENLILHASIIRVDSIKCHTNMVARFPLSASLSNMNFCPSKKIWTPEKTCRSLVAHHSFSDFLWIRWIALLGETMSLNIASSWLKLGAIMRAVSSVLTMD